MYGFTYVDMRNAEFRAQHMKTLSPLGGIISLGRALIGTQVSL